MADSSFRQAVIMPTFGLVFCPGPDIAQKFDHLLGNAFHARPTEFPKDIWMLAWECRSFGDTSPGSAGASSPLAQ
jgi:hypothetical protein